MKFNLKHLFVLGEMRRKITYKKCKLVVKQRNSPKYESKSFNFNSMVEWSPKILSLYKKKTYKISKVKNTF